MGPAALFVLRGLVCLQCNVKLPRRAGCATCKLTFCKSCQVDHFCVGKLNLPRGVAETAGDGSGGGGAKTTDGRKGGKGSSGSEGSTRWELGSAIGDDWEALFSEVM